MNGEDEGKGLHTYPTILLYNRQRIYKRQRAEIAYKCGVLNTEIFYGSRSYLPTRMYVSTYIYVRLPSAPKCKANLK